MNTIKSCLLLFFLWLPTILWGQRAVISFDTREHDFGSISEKGGKVSIVFRFTNQGDKPLIIRQVETSCGCIRSKWERRPVSPGREGKITLTYSPQGRPGRFIKRITVYTNATPPNHTLKISGNVIAKTKKQPNSTNQ